MIRSYIPVLLLSSIPLIAMEEDLKKKETEIKKESEELRKDLHLLMVESTLKDQLKEASIVATEWNNYVKEWKEKSDKEETIKQNEDTSQDKNNFINISVNELQNITDSPESVKKAFIIMKKLIENPSEVQAEIDNYIKYWQERFDKEDETNKPELSTVFPRRYSRITEPKRGKYGESTERIKISSKSDHAKWIYSKFSKNVPKVIRTTGNAIVSFQPIAESPLNVVLDNEITTNGRETLLKEYEVEKSKLKEIKSNLIKEFPNLLEDRAPWIRLPGEYALAKLQDNFVYLDNEYARKLVELYHPKKKREIDYDDMYKKIFAVKKSGQGYEFIFDDCYGSEDSSDSEDYKDNIEKEKSILSNLK